MSLAASKSSQQPAYFTYTKYDGDIDDLSQRWPALSINLSPNEMDLGFIAWLHVENLHLPILQGPGSVSQKTRVDVTWLYCVLIPTHVCSYIIYLGSFDVFPNEMMNLVTKLGKRKERKAIDATSDARTRAHIHMKRHTYGCTETGNSLG
ncbi:hypothetical protein GGS21DRAFT_507322 [Xylaria nigripes]|nr:hypothetical protein GGS21DRAFT_507322 [Xylaria nigripes]